MHLWTSSWLLDSEDLIFSHILASLTTLQTPRILLHIFPLVWNRDSAPALCPRWPQTLPEQKLPVLLTQAALLAPCEAETWPEPPKQGEGTSQPQEQTASV